MSIMNLLSITLIALILGAALALFLGVRSVAAQASSAPLAAPQAIAAL
ncbi:hypothetical protein [Gymnodinialimonas ceratoperidinii]|uniref:Uncharacterized protein n=1 Tax=Gymnodinialimonas ceratoperidinii TaxID=2856823 RepID=A0A8F6TWL2_9RHOB|nr:hypothetical protein [Gymnodinialimonas ceratoperidinii]QXT39254.1 hypothetical protein KYE46_15205 [Gymnodinialimonas ceratoperidinii]